MCVLKSYKERNKMIHLFGHKSNLKLHITSMCVLLRKHTRKDIYCKKICVKSTAENKCNDCNSKCCKYLNTFSFLIQLHLNYSREDKWLSMDQIFMCKINMNCNNCGWRFMVISLKQNGLISSKSIIIWEGEISFYNWTSSFLCFIICQFVPEEK